MIKKTTVTKTNAEFYYIRGNGFVWGFIALAIIGKESCQVLCNSDYGHYAYGWTHCGMNPKKFLCRLDMQYAMNKLTNGKLYEPDVDEYENDIKNSIIESRRSGNLTETEARIAWNEMCLLVDEYGCSSILFNELYNHPLFSKVFGSFENMPNSERIRPECQGFWDKIWIPFIEQLRLEINNE